MDLFNIKEQTKFYTDQTAILRKLNHDIKMMSDPEYKKAYNDLQSVLFWLLKSHQSNNVIFTE